MKIIIYWIFCYLKNDHFKFNIMVVMQRVHYDDAHHLAAHIHLTLFYLCVSVFVFVFVRCVLHWNILSIKQITENVVILTLESHINDTALRPEW